MASPSAAQEYIKKAADLREAGRLDEAVLAARRATTVDEDDANTWWQLSLATWERDGPAAAIPHLKKTVGLADGFAYGWHRLGVAYKSTAMLDQAIDCWERAIEEDSERADTLSQLVEAYQSRDRAGDHDKRFEALKGLAGLGRLDGHEWNLLGICYFERKQHQRAIQCYRRYAVETGSHIAFYNLGLALNSPEVQQRADAIDVWRRSFEVSGGNYQDAAARLKTWLPAMLELRQRVLEARREPPRVLRRLFSLRGLSYEQEVEPVFTRGPRTRCSHGA